MLTSNLASNLDKDNLLNNVQLTNITHISAEEDGTHVHIQHADTITLSSSLNQLGLDALSDNFTWANSSTIINLSHVLKYHHGAQSKIELVGGAIVVLSKKEQAVFLKKFVQF